MYVEVSNKQADDNGYAYLISPHYMSKGKSCVQFYYHMFGTDINALAVYINGNQEFGRYGNQNDTWHMGQAEVKNPGRFQVSLILYLPNVMRK